MLSCSGVIVFNPRGTETVLVKTHKGRYGFPKGKRHKNETHLDTALRELYEETGIKVLRVLDTTVDEVSRKGNPSVRYFIGTVPIDDTPELQFDPDELADVAWFPVNEALGLLEEKRHNLLRLALDRVAESKTACDNPGTDNRL